MRKGKQKGICAGLALISALSVVSGCSQGSDLTIEYGEEIDLAQLLGTKEDTTFSLSVDPQTVGTYVVRWDSDTQEKRVQVVDTQLPQISLYQEQSAKIPLGDSYDPSANIRSVSDPVDGAIKDGKVLEKEAYAEQLQQAQTYEGQLSQRVFEEQADVTDAKKEQKDQSFLIISSEVDTEKVGKYMVEVAAADKNGNISRKTFQVEVVEKADAISEEEMAVGSSHRPKMEEEEQTSSASDSRGESKSEASSSSQSSSSSSRPQGGSSKAPSVSDPVAKAALARVGQHLSCDDLVSYALMDAGRISGGNNWMGTVGVYYFPKLCTKVSASQARAGDIIYYADGGAGSPHVAIYLGGDEAVHGGYNGLNVVRTTIYLGGGPTYYLRFPSHMSWDEIDRAIFGESSDDFFEDDSSSGNDQPSGGQEGTTTYTATFSINDLSVTVESSRPIDEEKVTGLLEQVFYEEITYDEMVAQLKALGYRVV